MKLPQILSDLQSNWQTLTRAMEDTKLATLVSGYTFGVGFISAAFDMFRDGLPFLSMLAGFAVALLTIRARLRQDKRDLILDEKLSWELREVRERVLRMPGIETRKDDRL